WRCCGCNKVGSSGGRPLAQEAAQLAQARHPGGAAGLLGQWLGQRLAAGIVRRRLQEVGPIWAAVELEVRSPTDDVADADAEHIDRCAGGVIPDDPRRR